MNSTNSGQNRLGFKEAACQRDRVMLAPVNTGGVKGKVVFVSDEYVYEALWSAYGRCDKGTVTRELLRRYSQPSRKHRSGQPKPSHG